MNVEIRVVEAWQKMEAVTPIIMEDLARQCVWKVPQLSLTWPVLRSHLHPSPVGYSHPGSVVTHSHRSRMLSFPRVVACSRTCSRFLGLSLGTASLFAAGANIALLFPNWDTTYLTRGLIGKHAMLGAGLWGGGFMVRVQGFMSGNSLGISISFRDGTGRRWWSGCSNKLVLGSQTAQGKGDLSWVAGF